ncbi:MAG: biosynthetic peptidoglycan transglycosylase [Myxococcota bacterium]|nr:biosynthetic peptidoglycan transglycosylase [Myxococcota bacterium]
MIPGPEQVSGPPARAARLRPRLRVRWTPCSLGLLVAVTLLVAVAPRAGRAGLPGEGASPDVLPALPGAPAALDPPPPSPPPLAPDPAVERGVDGDTAAPRVSLDFLLGGRGRLSAASLVPGPRGQGLILADLQAAVPGWALSGGAERVEVPAGAAGPAVPADAPAEEPVRLLRPHLTLDLTGSGPTSATRPPALAGPSSPGPSSSSPPPLAAARRARAATVDGSRLAGERARMLLEHLLQITSPAPPAWLHLLPPLQLVQGSLQVVLPGARLRLEELSGSLTPQGSLLLAGRLTGPGASRGELNLELAWPRRTEQGELLLAGRVTLRDGQLSSPAIAAQPLTGLHGDATWSLVYDPGRATAVIEVAPLLLQGLRTKLTLTVRRLGQAPLAIGVALDLLPQPCQALVRTLPPAFAPRLQGLQLTGELRGRLLLDLDLRQRTEPITRLDLRGPGFWSRCQVGPLGPELAVERLTTSFVQTVRPPRPELAEVRIGPGTSGYVPTADLPAHVLQSMLLTENSSFFKHGPLAFGLIRKALNIDLRQGRYVYGGSTITQQLAKNLFLDGRKTLERKVEELFVAWRMEQLLAKERILELYVNCIEFAPGIYGIEAAAQYYFGHGARLLTPVEGVFLATIKPLPADGPRMARNRKVDGWWIKRVGEVMLSLEQLGLITAAERAAAYPYQPVFREDFVENARKQVRRVGAGRPR